MQPIATLPEQLDEVRAFLRERFECGPDALFLERAHCYWKYYAPRPDWAPTRSYVLRMDSGAISAHCCIVPIDIWNGERVVSSFHVSDRAGSPKAPGAAFLLGMMLMKMFETALAIGGNAQSARVQKADRVVAHPYGTTYIMTRALRPFRRYMGAGAPLDWKSPLRWGRDLGWNLRNPLAGARGWFVEPVTRFGSQPLPWSAAGGEASPHLLRCLRSPALLDYMLDCPAARFTGFVFRQDGAPRGHLLLSGRGGEARIADLAIQSNEAADWSASYALAARTAAATYPEATRVSAAAFPPFIVEALRATGFRESKIIEMRLTDKPKLLSEKQPLVPHINMMDWDEAYLY